MQRIVYCAIGVMVILSGCDLLGKAGKEAAQYDAAGNRLVSLTIDLGTGARSLTSTLAKAGVDYYEVVFKDQHNDDTWYRSTWTKSQKGKIKIPPGTYDGAGSAVLFAGMLKDKTLLAVGLLSAVNNDEHEREISLDTKSLTFTLAALTTNITDDGDSTAFRISAPEANKTPSGPLPAIMEQDINGSSYSVPVFLVPVTSSIAAQLTWDTSDGDPSTYYPALHIPSGEAGEGTLEFAGVVSGQYGPVIITPRYVSPQLDPATRTLTSPAFEFSFETPAENGLARIFFSQPVYALHYVEGKSIKWNIRGGLNNDLLDGGAAIHSIGGSILLGVGTLNLINVLPGTGSYTVEYHSNGGSGIMEASTFTTDVEDTLRPAVFSRTGFFSSFTGWATTADGPVQYTDGQSVTNLTTAGETITLYARWGIELVAVPGGTFTMGSPTTESPHYADETQHEVTVSAFHIGKYEVTQELYRAVMGTNPSSNTIGSNLPVEKVNWYDALVFCNTLSIRAGLQPVYTLEGKTDPAEWGAAPASSNATWNTATMDIDQSGYRLPTEAEWEYAARCGSAWNSPYYIYAGSNTIASVAWYQGNSGGWTYTVGLKAPNAWLLYDMSGNVFEWCWDRYDSTYYASSPSTNPTGPTSGTARVFRGGNFASSASIERSAHRENGSPGSRIANTGLRLARR